MISIYTALRQSPLSFLRVFDVFSEMPNDSKNYLDFGVDEFSLLPHCRSRYSIATGWNFLVYLRSQRGGGCFYCLPVFTSVCKWSLRKRKPLKYSNKLACVFPVFLEKWTSAQRRF